MPESAVDDALVAPQLAGGANLQAFVSFLSPQLQLTTWVPINGHFGHQNDKTSGPADAQAL